MRGKATASKAMRKLLSDRRKMNRGDLRARRRFMDTYVKWTTRANKMLDTLERGGYTRQAYGSAQMFITAAYGDNATRYATDLTSDKAIYRQLMSINHFFTLETSTLKGSKAVENRRVQALRDYFNKVDKDGNRIYSDAINHMSKKDILKFLDWLHDNPLGNFLADNAKWGSGYEMDDFMSAVYEQGRDYDELSKVLNKYKEIAIREAAGIEVPEDEKFYYDDMLKYLKGTHNIIFNGKKVKLVENPNYKGPKGSVLRRTRLR